ncbi:hypothetical protein MTQ01_07565 [Streptomyces sp. XM4193]|uniref:SCO2583 family membrane protein n=1 Tax=Streptomyces sp. XM4193 TaxID=2929782 RepID=UPI001FFA677A|nr:hypothetical protein [Streptomyces sp. XM4193]MCK1795864.1 hypothetical protein [Streptomyces sp. XM4193]
MAGRADPPEGRPAGDDDDEFRSTVFDESFVRAAQLREFSARERLDEQERPVADLPDPRTAERTQPGDREGAAPPVGSGRRGVSGQFLVLLLVVLIAFGAAIYMGARSPYEDPAHAQSRIPLRTTIVPLVPRGSVPGAEAEELYRSSPAARLEAGPNAVTLPSARSTTNFSLRQVRLALTTTRQYVIASALNPDVLAGRTVSPVRRLLSHGQRDQFDRSMRAPADDGRYGATGWLMRFQPEEAKLADSDVRVRGTFSVAETDSGALEVSAQHVLVYALRPVEGERKADASLFTARREVRMRFTRGELRTGVGTVAQVTVQAGPLPCAEDTHDWLRPLLAGEDVGADASAGTDLYAGDIRRTELCGVLARSAQPKVD